MLDAEAQKANSDDKAGHYADRELAYRIFKSK